uniref:Phosphatidylinositol glycan anchor biosynthesis class F n=1 Tax=Nomascus leucogenys TaxID=61853 RepID=A0A2I3GVC9_NOMLE
MKDTDIKKLLYTHILCIFSIILSVFIPSFFLENFSILQTHLTWLCICSGFVAAVNLVLYLVVKPNTSSKKVGVGNIFICSHFVYFYHCTLCLLEPNLKSMA